MLFIIADDPHVRIRDIAAAIGITERAAGSIVNDLPEAGYIERLREGRRNRYAIIPDQHLRHPTQCAIPVQTILDLFIQNDSTGGKPGEGLYGRL
ncbi:helix-turn-helix transcriptional regulator [Nonomuraea helvata]|uniref:Helix-turn-helix transcriptional regulator n=1 Tax=Nonomuraea helvata TaxID=37484 RepID=A0ABV5SL34_9ACTN